MKQVLAAVRYYPGTKTLSGDLRRYKEIWRIEKKYGRRLFPRSWAGAYLFDLSFYETQSRFEKTAFCVLKNARRIKKILLQYNHSSNKTRTIYGFYPLDTLVDDCGIIHLPWYDPRKWSTLRLKVDPATDRYQIKINGRACQKIRCENGHLVVPQLPRLDTPHRKISIRCEKTKRWRLLEFGCEFDIDINARSEG